MYAEIIINSNARALNRIFDYIIPNSLENAIKVGSRIFVPFGNGKKLEDGFVIGIKEKSEFANKEIAKIDEEESLTEEKILLAKLMARKYFCNISDCIKLMLPPGTGAKETENRTKEKLFPGAVREMDNSIPRKRFRGIYFAILLVRGDQYGNKERLL